MNPQIDPNPTNVKEIKKNQVGKIFSIIVAALVVAGGMVYIYFNQNKKMDLTNENQNTNIPQSVTPVVPKDQTTNVDDQKKQMIQEVVDVQAMIKAGDTVSLFNYMRHSVSEDDLSNFDALVSQSTEKQKAKLIETFNRIVGNTVDLDPASLGSTSATWNIEDTKATVSIEITPEKGTKITWYINFFKKDNHWYIETN